MKNRSVVISLISLFVLVCILLSLVLWIGREKFFQNGTSVNNSSSQKETLSTNHFQLIQGTSIFVATIEQEREWSPQLSARWFSYEYGYSARNLVFLDGNTLSSHYLFETNENYIVEISQFPSPYTYPVNDVTEIKWLVFKVAHEDSNADGLVNSADTFSLAVSDADGYNYAELIENIVFVYGMDLLKDSNLVVIYKTDNGAFASKINLSQRMVSETQPLAQIPTQDVP